MAHVLIVGVDGRTTRARLRLDGTLCKVRDSSAEPSGLPGVILGLATITVVSAAGWVLVLTAVKYLLR
jgi:hypothetical protein